jgi:hypothetical protein
VNPHAKAHALLAELIAAGDVVAQELVGVARSEEARLQVIVTFAPYAPLRLDPESAAALKARVAALPKSEPFLTPLQRRVLNVLNAQTPRKGVLLARDLDVAYGGGFRQALADLVKMGLVKNNGRGYLLTERPGGTS